VTGRIRCAGVAYQAGPYYGFGLFAGDRRVGGGINPYLGGGKQGFNLMVI